MLALSTDSLKGYGLNRIFQITKAAGYDGVDLVLDPKNFDTQNAEYVKSLIDQTGLPVLGIQTPPNCSPRKVQEAVKMAKLLGTRVIVIQPPKIFDFKYIQWLKNEIPKIRQTENISIALENAPSQTFLGIIPEHAMGNILDLKKFKHVCIDTTRVAQKRDDLIRVYKALKKYLVHVHLSNVKGGNYYYLPPKGILPIESFLTKLKQDSFPGTISLKVNSKYLDAGDDQKVMKALQEQKLFFDTYFTNVKVMPVSLDPVKDEDEKL
jgi:sugar phosphate isomerase/epimerase